MLTAYHRRLAALSMRSLGIALIGTLAIALHAPTAAHAVTVSQTQSLSVAYNFNPIAAVPAGGYVIVQGTITAMWPTVATTGPSPGYVGLSASLINGSNVVAGSATALMDEFPGVFPKMFTTYYTGTDMTGQFLLSALGDSIANILAVQLQVSVFNSSNRVVRSGFVTRTFDEDDFMVSAIGQTPLPAALPLLASVLGAAGLIGWRRKRRQDKTARQDLTLARA